MMRAKKRFQDSKNRSRDLRDRTTKKENRTTKEKDRTTRKKRDYATKRQQIFENITRRNSSAFEYVEIEIIDFIVENNVKNIQMFVNQSIFSIRVFSVFIRSSITYFEFSMTQFSSTSYYDFFSSSQTSRPSQMYSQ